MGQRGTEGVDDNKNVQYCFFRLYKESQHEVLEYIGISLYMVDYDL